MAIDKRLGSKIPKWANRDAVAGTRLDAATYIGIVKNNLDPARSGRLQIWIPDFGGDENSEQNWRTVSYASPFFGATYQPESSKNNTFENVNHTYGMWTVPPDIGNQVLCTFVNGDPDRGYWFACVNPTLSHYMVPGIAAGNKVDKTNIGANIKVSVLSETATSVPQSLPVAEFNENKDGAISDKFYNNEKPIHEFQANVLFKQGLDRDKLRGAITSSSQRETPSHVFGISTPGRAFGNDPADDPNYASKLAKGSITESEYAVKSRKGGHQFVMDDGDVNGDDQLIRLRTSSGHQILMNDTKKFMYIANSEGSVWIELAESGQMHIYTAGGFNLHTDGDMNLHAGKNLNMQAEGSVNIAAASEINQAAAKINISGAESLLAFGGKASVGAGGALTIGGGTIGVSSGGALTLAGGTIDINGGSGGNSLTGGNIPSNNHADTSFDDQTRLWVAVPNAANSICTILPQHEPWDRGGQGPAPTKQASTTLCSPKGVSGSMNLNVSGKDGEDLCEQTFLAAGVKDPIQLAQMMAQCAAESGGFKYLKELGNDPYFDKYDNMGVGRLGNTGHDDGRKFKGRGYIQVTGRKAYTAFAAYSGLDCVNNPEIVETPENSAKMTLFWFDKFRRDAFPNGVAGSPRGCDWSDTQQISYYVNGKKPANGIEHRLAYFDKYKAKYQAQMPTYRGGAPASSSSNLQSGSGATVTDGSGQPVKTGSATSGSAGKDVGITTASGKPLVGDSCPAEYMSKTDTYNPPGGIGDKTPKFTQLQVKAMMCELGYFESKFTYNKQGEGTRIGKYQVDAEYLSDSSRGYVKPDAFKQYGLGAVSNNESWAGKDSITSQAAFFENKTTQDTIQYEEFKSNYDKLRANGGIKDSDDICMAAGMLFVAHQMRSVDKAKQWRDTGDVKDALNKTGDVYYNHGRYAIDNLSQAGPSGAAPSGENTTGINPDDIFTFTGATGTRERFDQLSGTFKNALLQAGKAYKDKTGSKIQITSAYRSQSEQDGLYQRWLAAGGRPKGTNGPTDPGVPTAGGITTPSKDIGSHGGVAIDSTQSAVVSSTINLADFGLRWGGEFGDAVHIQLRAWRPGAPIPS